ncbi:MAG: hypothetical protein RLZZ502_1714 [Pseudomonadota bacterium]|jgi:predicted ATP-grasp superfamily ATP-dependent carboligase
MSKDVHAVNQTAALVLSVDTPIGLTVLRELGAHGVHVVALSRQAASIGFASRYAREKVVLSQQRELALKQLVALSAQHPHACLYVMGEADILWLNTVRTQIPLLNCRFPSTEHMRTVLNKDDTAHLAAECGIRTIKTIQLTDLTDATLARLQYPLLCKWANPHRVSPQLEQQGLPLDKLKYLYNADQAKAYLSPFLAAKIELPLLMPYVPGTGLGQCYHRTAEGEITAYFQHRRIHEWPPEGGSSALCESVAPTLWPDLDARSRTLLARLDWSGVAMVEYRADLDTARTADDFTLMEINGRFWGSLPLASQAGVHFAVADYQAATSTRSSTNTRSNTTPPSKASTETEHPSHNLCRAQYFLPSLKHVLRVLLQPSKIPDKHRQFPPLHTLWQFTCASLSPFTKRFVFRWSDPLPSLRDLRNMLTKH